MAQSKTDNTRRPTLREYSPITWGLERFFRGLQYLPPQCLLFRSSAGSKQLKPDSEVARRSRVVEAYIVICLLCEVLLGALYLTAGLPAWWVRIPILLRMIDLLQSPINATVFDQLRHSHKATSIRRSLALTSINFVELVVCFGLIYVTGLHTLCGATAWYDAFYFSAVTQLTIGYGDIHPVGVSKLLAVLQGIAGVALIVIVFGRVIGTFQGIREIFTSGPDAT